MQSIPLKQYTSPLESINSINDAHTEFKRVYKKGGENLLGLFRTGESKTP